MELDSGKRNLCSHYSKGDFFGATSFRSSETAEF